MVLMKETCAASYVWTSVTDNDVVLAIALRCGNGRRKQSAADYHFKRNENGDVSN